MTQFLCRHHNYVIEKRHQNNITKIFHFGTLQSKFLAITPMCTSILCWSVVSIRYTQFVATCHNSLMMVSDIFCFFSCFGLVMFGQST